jgi:peptidoglycan/xylan/chitin deacetylase (PgdA/CDA1 family)
MKTTVLMYHAIGTQPGIDEADPHYSVSVESFSEHLTRLNGRGLGLRSVRDVIEDSKSDKRAVAITFDDGHISNFDAAFPALLAAGATADFFVNPSNVGRAHFATWAALREMDQAGMSIQSHVYTHRYLEDLSVEEAREELTRSKAMIEDKLGRPVTLFAPPGGRINATVHRLAREAGYQHVCVSQPGQWRPGLRTVPRFAVLAATMPETIEAWAEGRAAVLARYIAGYWVRYAAKKALGNALYDRVRERILSHEEREA